jgi:ribosome-associated protein
VEESNPISKTQRKREMLELQTLGEDLTRLTEAQLSELELPERLLDAVLEARRISKFGALRRQLQYIGRLMREVDSEAIAARLEAWKGTSREATAHLHLLERWRERLLVDDAALFDLAHSYPGCDTQKIRLLIRNARREREASQAPRSFRALFQELRELIPDHAADS